jgi:dihydrofolate reductase
MRARTLKNLIYVAITSLDGYVADDRGNFDWAVPDDEVHAFINDLERPIGTYLYGRRMYDTMAGWETADGSAAEGSVAYDFAKIWKAANKVVYSKTLDEVRTVNTRVEREFDATAIARMKKEATADITIGGPHLAAAAFAAGLVNECRLFIAPVIIGGGNRSLPNHVRLDLQLVQQRQFQSGFAYLRYRAAEE